MATTNLGPVSMSAGGVYNPETEYKKYKVVSANGGSYMYINPTPAAGVPVTDTTHWQQIASVGGQDILDAVTAEKNAAIAAKVLAEGYAAQLAAGTASPAGTYADLAALTAANPDHSKIYISLDDGKWCYHNGSAWVAGGVYQAAMIADGSISISKVAFSSVGKNLFDKSKASANNLGLSKTTGATGYAQNCMVSDYIPVDGNAKYCRTFSDGVTADDIMVVCYYDINKVFISGENPSTFNTVLIFTTPATCAFIRTSWRSTLFSADIIQMEKGHLPTVYEPYRLRIDKEHIKEPGIGEVPLSKMEFASVGKNLFDKTAVFKVGFGLNTATGEMGSYANNRTSGYIPVKPETLYTRTNSGSLGGADDALKFCYYDANKVFISGEGIWPVSNVLNFTTPAGCAYVRTTWNNTKIHVDEMQVVEGGILTGYEPFAYTIPRAYIEDLKDDDLDKLRLRQNDYKILTPNAFEVVRRPLVTFVLDDGWVDDYTVIRPISETYNVPFVIAFPSGGTLYQWQGLYLQNTLGWEIAGHTHTHIDLTTLETEAEIEEEIYLNKKFLVEQGYKVECNVYAYGGYDERVRRVAKKYFKCAATGIPGINTGVVASFSLHRQPFGAFQATPTLETYKAYVDSAVSSTGWLIFMLHPHFPEHDAAQNVILGQLIEYIQGIGVDIVTLSQGYEVFGNVVEAGAYVGGADGFAISKSGLKANI